MGRPRPRVRLRRWQALMQSMPSFVALLWPALFLSLGWNFLAVRLRPTGHAGGGSSGAGSSAASMFVLMGGLPLIAMLPVPFAASRVRRSGLGGGPVGMPLAQMQRVAARVQPAAASAAEGHGGRARAPGEAPRPRRVDRRRVRGREGEAPVSAACASTGSSCSSPPWPVASTPAGGSSTGPRRFVAGTPSDAGSPLISETSGRRSSGLKPSRPATSSLDGCVPSQNNLRRRSPVVLSRHQSSPTSPIRYWRTWAERIHARR